MERAIFGKVAVVTGGGRGIGKCLAHALTREGAKVAICDLDPEVVFKAAAEVGGSTLGVPLDVTDHAAFTEFLNRVERELGPIDVLINNAGIMPLGPVEDESDEVADRQLAINVSAVIHGTKEAVRRMRPRRTGHIVNISSILGRAGLAGGATYSACKFGVFGFSEAVKRELKGSGVEITVVFPAVVKTELASGITSAHLVRAVTPEEVADGIVGALKSPKFELYFPKIINPLLRVLGAMPFRVRDIMARVLGADRTLLGANATARANYESWVVDRLPEQMDRETTRH